MPTNRQRPAIQQTELELHALPGDFNDDGMVRSILSEVIKHSDKSREQICEEITALLGKEVTVAMLNTFTADSKEGHRWPIAWTRAFCHVTGNWKLLEAIAHHAGMRVVSADDLQLMELGRQYLINKRSATEMSSIEARLGGHAL